MRSVGVFVFALFLVFAAAGVFGTQTASATAIGITPISGSQADDYIIGTPAPLPFTLTGDFSNELTLYLWDEVQNMTLSDRLYVDRVADNTAAFIGYDHTKNSYFIEAGTIVSSHYVQWDPIGSKTVEATLEFDSDIFAFITNDQKLFDSDQWLGLPGIDYGDFNYRGLEGGDGTNFNGANVDIGWTASSPGDWTRLITAYSPGGEPVPEPATILLLATGLVGIAGFRKRV